MTFEEACKLSDSEMYEECDFNHVTSICYDCIHRDKCPVSQYTDNHDDDEVIWRCKFYEW